MLLHNYTNQNLTNSPETAETNKESESLPPYLYYGTGTDFFPPGKGDDIYPECGKIYVHLYDNVLPAVCVGATRGKPVIYLVNSRKMAEDGYVFHHSAGRIWMTEKVPAEYIEKINALKSSAKKALVHSIGKNNAEETVLTEYEFVSRLERVRQQILNEEMNHIEG